MENHKINPILAKSINIAFSKLLFPTKEYFKENLTDSSYIFAPNHTNNLDGYLIWSLLSPYYDINTFMYREFWDNYPNLAKFMPIFNVLPITRDKLVLTEIKNELKKLQEENHSLIIFPQGRHVDYILMKEFPEEHLKTLPLGAFFFSALSSKPIIPIFMEPQKLFANNIVAYGKPINPLDYNIKKENGKINTETLTILAKEWINEINNLHKKVSELENRDLRKYQLRDNYFDANGKHNLPDPNVITNYIDIIKAIKEISISSGIKDLQTLGELLDVQQDILNTIQTAKNTYDQCLVRRKTQ